MVTSQHLHRVRSTSEKAWRRAEIWISDFQNLDIMSTFMEIFCCEHLKYIFSYIDKHPPKNGRLSVQLSGSDLCYRYWNLTLSWEENGWQSGISSSQQKFLAIAFLQNIKLKEKTAMLEVTGSEWDVQRFETEWGNLSCSYFFTFNCYRRLLEVAILAYMICG